MKFVSEKVWAIAVISSVLCGTAQAQSPAQSYPNKFVKFIVTYPRVAVRTSWPGSSAKN